MKKLLTTAALLTIGTAASFATEFTLIGNNTYGDDYVSAGRAAFKTITLDDGTLLENGAILNGSLYDWSISFSLTSFYSSTASGDSATSQKTLFSVSSSGGTGEGYGIIAYEDTDGNIYYSLTSTTQNHDNSPTLIGDPIQSSFGELVTISWSAVASTISISVGETTYTSDALASAVSLQTYAGGDVTIGGDADKSSVFWTNTSGSNSDAIANITLSATKTVPEPSMFGLLAGLGAIGLVAARRRRNRKA